MRMAVAILLAPVLLSGCLVPVWYDDGYYGNHGHGHGHGRGGGGHGGWHDRRY